MSENNFGGLKDSTLHTTLKEISDNVNAAFASYGLTTLQGAAWEAAADDFGVKIGAVENAKVAYEAAVVAKDVSRASLLSTTTDMTGIIYAFPGITDVLLASAGLAVYSTTKTPKVPSTPSTPLALPSATGDVKLKWNRLSNPTGITFVIESKGETGDWAQVATTTAAKITLSGYIPGVPRWFRIVATHRGLSATPTLPVAIYHEEGGTGLSLAA